jgi:two-component system nitrogen regulation sensor histidine kinase NtrY
MRRVGITLTAVTLTVLTVGIFLEISLFRLKAAPAVKIVIIILFNITLLALLTLAFFVGKSLIKLYFEHKRRIAGHIFKTKLVTTFVGITLVPSIMLFVIAGGLVTNYIDKWFSPQVSRPLESSLFIAKNLYEMLRKEVLHEARNVARGAKPSPGYYAKYIAAPPDSPIAADSDDAANRADDAVGRAFSGRESVEVKTREEIDLLRAVVPVYESGRVTKVLVVETVVPREFKRRVEDIQSAYNEYAGLIEYAFPLKVNYLIILGFFTLLVVFMALWVALRISRNITRPIESLVEATSRVSRGDFDVHVDAHPGDEVGMLIDSFNTMIEKIKDAEVSLHNAWMESDRRRLYMENIIENINSGVITLNAESRIISINDAACTILGTTVEEVLNKHYTELLRHINSPELEKFLKDINLYNFHSSKEQLRVSVGGRKMVLRLFVGQLRDSLDVPMGLLVVFDDLTDLIQAEKAMMWQDVAKRIAHEIKNPLTPIKLSAERLLKRWQSGDKNFQSVIEKSTSTIVREVDGLQKLVNEFSRLGRMPDVVMAECDLKSLITDVIDLYRDYEKVSVSLDYRFPKATMKLDAEHFRRVLINIIDNAMQAVGESGIIDVVVDVNVSSGTMVLKVSDNGKGIAEEDKARLFQPYFTGRKGGTGLGLAIAHKIVTDHKGFIGVSDNVPRGTVFTIEIPCCEAKNALPQNAV